MKRTTGLVVVGVIFIALIGAVRAAAGGWASITLDSWPQDVAAQNALQIGFTVRQHGHDDRRMTGLEPTISAQNVETGEELRVSAVEEGSAGHYVAEIIFPSPGSWSWSIQAFTMDQSMPLLEVANPVHGKAISSSQTRTGLAGLPLIAGGLGLALVAGAVVLVFGRRARWALALLVIGLAAGGVGLASAADRPEKLPAPEPAASLTPAELGERLFVAKGCVACHRNSRIDPELVDFQTDMGPVLSDYRASKDFLTLWLKDPKAAKPMTEMPNLELSAVEIDALIAFLSTEP